MRPLRILAVDDEPPALDDLAYLLRGDHRVGRVVTADSSDAALRLLESEQIDAVFLDIRMPGLDGLDLVRVLRRFAHPPAVVFVTAYEDFAVDAFALKASDYLLKPLGAERLAEAVRRVAALLDGGAQQQPAAADPAPERIPVDLGGITRFVSRDEVAYAEAQGDYVRLHTAGHAPLVRVPLAVLAERWEPHGFLRIHRSYLVSLRHVEELRSEAGHWTVKVAGSELPVSRRHTRELRDVLVRWAPEPGAGPA
ncbi:LytR/AlgR family response regulator transcription factor [Actinacidiphila bryophytorum]|jgi:DNA-binding LytR/AlgR family response regulator|uniref:Two component transcriptional regulator, LytTR family n=1 Tax=Actinacidiphila bryophytorum TaxID=1436133 RepID=A0A9W4H7H7_9ACTN|nr:LytTR family DNA-binding domain-containing protein [Actinacidiphila bryophytorum]MBM9437543.1 response regulator transcription factor [Actinacidiphila bryophytorum]MBN6546845.1 response regulator transcription factor [Actinacidiphila bryophytorum]UWE09619.1 LytTR family DNA-binding domain-containing protein [Actinacidiphila bryophytorum]CAG7655993.1 Two component transcriptional regulator, LytTR family [Actinacidiphila bryophytorum]